MTTYFYRNSDGSAYSQVLQNVAPLYNPYHLLAADLVPYPDYMLSQQQLGASSVVSSSLKHCGLKDSNASSDSDDENGSKTVQDPAWHEYVGYTFSSSSEYDMTGAEMSSITQYDRDIFKYPNPEVIRGYHSLHSLLPFIQPARLRNSVLGSTLDIVEEGTNHVFATAVPKKMLVLFCGRKVINKLLRTLEREDNEKWKGGPVTQELRFPRNYTNHIGLKILVAWMNRACRLQKHDTKPIHIPKNLFAALSLSRALTALGLHRDADRVDNYIAAHHYKRPLYPDEIVSIWNCLPKDSKYTYRMIEDLREQRYKYECGNNKAFPEAEKVLEFLEKHPDLKARVDDKDCNDRAEYRPFFGTEWCSRAALHTQKIMASMPNVNSTEASTSVMHKLKNPAPIEHREDYRQSGHQRYELSKARPQAQKHVVTLSDSEPHAPPSDWPEFEKAVVLKIVEAQEKTEDFSGGRKDSAYGNDDRSQ